MTITEFINARLAEEETVAGTEVDGLMAQVHPYIRAARKILAEHYPTEPRIGPWAGKPCCACCGAVDDDPYLVRLWPCNTLRYLAAIWDGHPEYTQEWRPQE